MSSGKMSGGFLALQQQRRLQQRRQLIELEDAFKEADVNQEGRINAHAWVTVLSSLGHNSARQEVEQTYRQLDAPLELKLSFEEFCGQKSRYERAFELLDKNGDGYVSRSEFKRLCPTLSPQQQMRAFDKFDQDGTGKISYEEFKLIIDQSKANLNGGAQDDKDEMGSK